MYLAAVAVYLAQPPGPALPLLPWAVGPCMLSVYTLSLRVRLALLLQQTIAGRRAAVPRRCCARAVWQHEQARLDARG